MKSQVIPASAPTWVVGAVERLEGGPNRQLSPGAVLHLYQEAGPPVGVLVPVPGARETSLVGVGIFSLLNSWLNGIRPSP